ncbi:hypothetical protein ACFOND_06655 [Reinekea marina]|uniref:Uncharacterized protein n=2 Tax=Reinekea marina TaxID=1310421 RepID=A0ABV7WPY0_9GAMM
MAYEKPKIQAMANIELILPYLLAIQWIVACLFVPILCWYEGLSTSKFCVTCAVISGYGVQFGFYKLMDGAGFSDATLIMFSAMAAYIWIHYLVRAWPDKKEITNATTPTATEDNTAPAN